MRTWLWLAMRPKPAHPVQEDVDFLILLNVISFILYTAETFLKVIVFLFCFSFCNFEVLSFILVLENKCDCSPHKSALSCFVAFSVPCPGLLYHFLSPVVFVVSLYLILFSLLASCVCIYIYIYIYIYLPDKLHISPKTAKGGQACRRGIDRPLDKGWSTFLIKYKGFVSRTLSFSGKCWKMKATFSGTFDWNAKLLQKNALKNTEIYFSLRSHILSITLPFRELFLLKVHSYS